MPIFLFHIYYQHPELPSLTKVPSSLLISTALPSFSIPQVHHKELYCVSALGRERSVQPLTMCCRWTHLRRPETTVQSFHTHTHFASFCLRFHARSIPRLCFHFTPCSLFFRSHFHCFWNSATVNSLWPRFLKPVFVTKQPCSKRAIDETLRFQSKSGSRAWAGGMEGRRNEGRYNLRGPHCPV